MKMVCARQCLKKWCDLAYEMDEDYAEDLLDYDFFEEYLESIIEDEINGDNDISQLSK